MPSEVKSSIKYSSVPSYEIPEVLRSGSYFLRNANRGRPTILPNYGHQNLVPRFIASGKSHGFTIARKTALKFISLSFIDVPRFFAFNPFFSSIKAGAFLHCATSKSTHLQKSSNGSKCLTIAPIYILGTFKLVGYLVGLPQVK